MNEEAKKKLLRMIPHALYILTCNTDGKTAASTISWVTQASFQPPLIVLGLKKESHTFEMVKRANSFALNFPGVSQKDIAQKFFKHITAEENHLAGEPYLESPLLKHPIFSHMAGFLECRVLDLVDRGDHVVVVAQVIEAQSGLLEGPLMLSSTGWQYGG